MWRVLWAKVGILTIASKNIYFCLDKGIQRGKRSYCGADRFLPERDQHRTGACSPGSRSSCRQSMKSESHLNQVIKPIIHAVTTAGSEVGPLFSVQFSLAHLIPNSLF